MEFVTFDDFDGTIQDFLDGSGEFLAAIAPVRQHVGNARQRLPVKGKSLKGALPVRDVGGRDVNEMRQALRVYADMALDSGNLFPCVIAFVFGGIRIFHALRVNDQKTCLLVAPAALSNLANRFFLRPPQGRSLFPLPVSRSICANIRSNFSMSGSLSGASAIDSRSSAHKAIRRKHRINPTAGGSSSSDMIPIKAVSSQIERE